MLPEAKLKTLRHDTMIHTHNLAVYTFPSYPLNEAEQDNLGNTRLVSAAEIRTRYIETLSLPGFTNWGWIFF